MQHRVECGKASFLSRSTAALAADAVPLIRGVAEPCRLVAGLQVGTDFSSSALRNAGGTAGSFADCPEAGTANQTVRDRAASSPSRHGRWGNSLGSPKICIVVRADLAAQQLADDLRQRFAGDVLQKFGQDSVLALV